ncbi:chorismate synthase [Candidatus Arthromitus sp. SFB-mouse-Japan]|uniref:chorismate synthase n=1 Tax=unclassified Candidatus Neoarthromitus TaxID=2638829 RepID=UPI00021B81DB|nr:MULTISPECIES: chorismate synthase [unclassified Candidatus Arthromitus]EIA25464.1 Chorismate synthase [Candidatus Arthromitus sp. SFB-2]EIA27640.1 Chorismate synthase [Candidatus Arthromitus sp. SFB-4]EIA28061.1 Chorismate synthase [Candidatus Arthromitus sp. SFB-co]EIA29980.1 Chorismate synthase [Candidatus Arthromitus sp. SFB-mouse-SU]AID45173.1 Chorismate synthase [Candidatus Arthromitus sp. SFB-mouse-NL]
MRYFTAGESHGKGLIGIIEGLPSNVYIDENEINNVLEKRQSSYGRGDRMKIESDKIEFISGIRNSKTLGSPISFFIKNADYKNWEKYMDPVNCDISSKRVLKPRPGHADLSGIIKYDFDDCRNVLERSSARETATRLAIGSICTQFLRNFNIESASHVLSIGKIKNSNIYCFDDIKRSDEYEFRFLDTTRRNEIVSLIDCIKSEGDTVGGSYELRIKNVPVGLGSYTHYDRKLDGLLASALISVNSMKAIEFGDGLETFMDRGSNSHDEIIYENGNYRRITNRAGGIEGGMSNGEEIVIRCYHKPIPTLYKPIKTVNILSKEVEFASVERSDYTVIPAASIVSESVAMTVICQEFLRKFSGDSLKEVLRSWKNSFLN